MSRIGKRPVEVPKGVDVTVNGSAVRVKGPKGELTLNVHPTMQVKVEGGEVIVARPSDAADHKALHGLTRTLIANMVGGVADGYKKGLEIHGREERQRHQDHRGLLTHGAIRCSVGDLDRHAEPDHGDDLGRGQADGRPGRVGDPRGPSAGALQRQGHPVSG